MAMYQPTFCFDIKSAFEWLLVALAFHGILAFQLRISYGDFGQSSPRTGLAPWLTKQSLSVLQSAVNCIASMVVSVGKESLNVHSRL